MEVALDIGVMVVFNVSTELDIANGVRGNTVEIALEGEEASVRTLIIGDCSICVRWVGIRRPSCGATSGRCPAQRR